MLTLTGAQPGTSGGIALTAARREWMVTLLLEDGFSAQGEVTLWGLQCCGFIAVEGG